MRIAEPTLAVVAQGVKDTTLNGRGFSYGPGQFLVVSIDLPVIGRITQGSEDEPFLALVLELLDAPDDAPALAAGVEREILWRLMAATACPPGSRSATHRRRCSALLGAIARLLAPSAGSAATTKTRCASKSSRHWRR